MGQLFKLIAPGLLVAATGVGSGDIITATLAGSHLGLTVLWAPLLGAILKYCLSEGLTRWQLATGETLVEGWLSKLGKWIQYIFLPYLIVWSFMVAGALISACGVAGDALIPLSSDPQTSKVIWGILHSIFGLVLVRFGNYQIFEKLMGIVISLMFITVFVTTFLMMPDLSQVLSGILIPKVSSDGIGWVIGVLGGVGGTVTILSYGYWIRESGRKTKEDLKTCRIDLGVAYGLTALFSLCMIIIGSKITLVGAKAQLPVLLGAELEKTLGTSGKYIFLVGFWGAVTSSLLGVWQSVPYLFSDIMHIRSGKREEDLMTSKSYRRYMYAIAIVPIVTLFVKFEVITLAYAVMGAMFMPLLAVTLLIMNNKKIEDIIYRNRWLSNALLIITLGFFAYSGVIKLLKKFG